MLETVLDDSGILTVDGEPDVDVVLTVLWGLLSEADTIFSEALEATGLLVELTELDELAELVKLAELDIDVDDVYEDVLSEAVGSFVDVW